eukprot:80366_1
MWINLDTVQRLLWDYCFGLLVLIELKLMNVFCVCDGFVSVNVEGICVPLASLQFVLFNLLHIFVSTKLFFLCASPHNHFCSVLVFLWNNFLFAHFYGTFVLHEQHCSSRKCSTPLYRNIFNEPQM